jgi:Arc/MetJ-type ribon-helix-helix transcriptional regulator
VQEEIQRGHFHSVDEVIVQGVYALREKSKAVAAPPRKPRKNLADFLSESPFAGSEIDLERQRDYGRPVAL